MPLFDLIWCQNVLLLVERKKRLLNFNICTRKKRFYDYCHPGKTLHNTTKDMKKKVLKFRGSYSRIRDSGDPGFCRDYKEFLYNADLFCRKFTEVWKIGLKYISFHFRFFSKMIYQYFIFIFQKKEEKNSANFLKNSAYFIFWEVDIFPNKSSTVPLNKERVC